MNEENKNNALSDDALDAVTGGTGSSGNGEWYTCGKCGCGRMFYYKDGQLTCEKCGGHDYRMVVIVPITTDD